MGERTTILKKDNYNTLNISNNIVGQNKYGTLIYLNGKDNRFDQLKVSSISWEVEAKNLILERIWSTKGIQSLCVSLVEINGTPRYLTGRELNLKPKRVCTEAQSSSLSPNKKTWIFSRFVISPNNP